MSEKIDLPFRTERLSSEEIQLLRRRMVGIWVFGIGIGGLAGYFIFIGLYAVESMKIPLTIFVIFFYTILAFIIFIHTWNAFQTEKRIYSGKITDKRTEASSYPRKSMAHEEYYIALDGSWFKVDLTHFQDVHVGDLVEVFTLGKKQVFKIDRKITSPNEVPFEQPVIEHKTNLYTTFADLSEQLTHSEKSVLKSHIRKALFYRTILGFLGGWLLYLIVNTAAVLITLGNGSGFSYFLYIHYTIWALLLIGYLLLNRRTWMLLMDLRIGKKEIVTDKIVDLVQSNHLKPGPNSIVKTINTSNYTYYYIHTEKFWLQANEETFIAATPGKELLIQRGINSHVILNFGF